MYPIVGVPINILGVECTLRWSVGAVINIRKRFQDEASLARLDMYQLAEAAYYLAFDEDGNPPSIPEPPRLLYRLNPEAAQEIAAAVLAASTNGGTSKNEMEALLAKRREELLLAEVTRLTGSSDTPKPGSASGSTSESSTGDIQSTNSPHSTTNGSTGKNLSDESAQSFTAPLQPQ